MRKPIVRSRVLAAVGFSVLIGFGRPADAQVLVDGYWRLTEDDPGAMAGAAGNSVTLDRSWNNRSLTRVGVPAYSSAVAPVGPGSCGSMSFAGNSRYGGPAVTSATDNFGIEAWVRPAALSAQMIAYIGHSGGNGFGLYQNGPSFALLYGGIILLDIAPVSLGQWAHLALVRSNGITTAYVNGIATVSGAFGPAAATGLMHIGGNSYWEVEAFFGQIDEVRVFRFTPGQFNPSHLLVNQLPPPVASAGVDFSVNEGQTSVALGGSVGCDPLPGARTYSWAQLGGTPVNLSDRDAQYPTFDAPLVPLGGETLSFELTVTANGKSSIDQVSVTVVNTNHPPVADAGPDQSLAEGSPVTLHGEDSFDIDADAFTYAWVQVAGDPAVVLSDPAAAQPTFTAPVLGSGGTPGVVATLVFELRVDDGYPEDAPAPGYTFANVVDRVSIAVTNVNNEPTAAAGEDQTRGENSAVTLSGAASSDPDSDSLTYAWAQVQGPPVVLAGGTTASPGFVAPFVSAGGIDLEFSLTVSDGYGGSSTDSVVVHVQNTNDPPLAAAARPTVALLWPPNHGLVTVGIVGVSDADNNATILITGVTQDEPTNGLGDGDTPVDAIIGGDGTVLLRAERSGRGDGRVYRIHFVASDLEGSSPGVVKVTVPRDKKSVAVDGGGLFDSTR